MSSDEIFIRALQLMKIWEICQVQVFKNLSFRNKSRKGRKTAHNDVEIAVYAKKNSVQVTSSRSGPSKVSL